MGSKSHASLKAEMHQSSPLSDVAGVSDPNQGTHTTSRLDSHNCENVDNLTLRERSNPKSLGLIPWAGTKQITVRGSGAQ